MASDCRKIRGQSIRRGMLGSFSIVLLLLVLNATPSNATISFIDSGRTYPSKPDPLLGQPLLRGFDYMGRLQYVSENPTLCPGMYPNQRFQIKTPSDGLPVALVAQSGGCSIYEKLKVASSLIIPSNTVGYLIVQDSSKRHHKDFLNEDADFHDSRQTVNTMTEDDPWRAGEKDSFFSSPQLYYEFEDEETESYVLPLLDSSDWKVAESNGRKLLESPTPNQGLLQLKHEYFTGVGDERLGDVNMAVLHVSPTTGQALFHYLASEPQQNRHQGGTRILLNGKENSFASRTLVVWMLITFSGCACFCACLLLCMQTTFEEEPEAQAPPRPRRRRLTFEEVRSRFPSYTFHNGCVSCETEPPDHGGYMQLSDECTICLDEFHPGDRVRKLPCDHVFHSTCIAKWLVERHATCPLCKLDLYIEPEDDDSSSSDTPPEVPSGGLGHWLQNTFFSGASGYTPLVIPSGSPDEAALLESTTNNDTAESTEGDEPRSWWPFSVETAPSTAEEEETQHDGGVRSSPLSDAAGVLSSWARSVVGRRRHHRLVASSSNDNEAANRLTELTEPLVPQMELQVSPSSSTSSSSSATTDTIHNTTTTTTMTTTTEI